MRKGSIKNMQINSEVMRELSVLIRSELHDPRIHPMTSVISCEVTTDLKLCKVFVSVLADEMSKKETMEGLKSAAPFLRRALAGTVNLRNTPELKFYLDDSIAYGMHMDKLIEEVTKDLPKEDEAADEENN